MNTCVSSLSGLLRGIDVDSRCFYITTPEDSESLSRVNVLVLDQAEDPDSIVSRKASCRAI